MLWSTLVVLPSSCIQLCLIGLLFCTLVEITEYSPSPLHATPLLNVAGKQSSWQQTLVYCCLALALNFEGQPPQT